MLVIEWYNLIITLNCSSCFVWLLTRSWLRHSWYSSCSAASTCIADNLDFVFWICSFLLNCSCLKICLFLRLHLSISLPSIISWVFHFWISRFLPYHRVACCIPCFGISICISSFRIISLILCFTFNLRFRQFLWISNLTRWSIKCFTITDTI